MTPNTLGGATVRYHCYCIKLTAVTAARELHHFSASHTQIYSGDDLIIHIGVPTSHRSVHMLNECVQAEQEGAYHHGCVDRRCGHKQGAARGPSDGGDGRMTRMRRDPSTAGRRPARDRLRQITVLTDAYICTDSVSEAGLSKIPTSEPVATES